METPGVIDLGIKDNVRRVEPVEKKSIESYDVEDFIHLFNETEWRNNGVVDLEIE